MNLYGNSGATQNQFGAGFNLTGNMPINQQPNTNLLDVFGSNSNIGLSTSPGLSGFGTNTPSTTQQSSETLTLNAAEDTNINIVFHCKKVRNFC